MSEVKTIKIKDIGRIDSGFAFSSADFQEFGHPVIRMSDLKKGYVQTQTAARVPSSKTIGLERFQVKPGDLLLGMSGSLDAYGVAGDDIELSYINQRVGRLTIFDEKKSCYSFFSRLLTSTQYLQYAYKEAVGVAQLNISPKQIEDFSFPQISLEEQKCIAQIFDALDTTIDETEAIITKLKSIKQGLLHDLLTRGIDTNGELRPTQAEAPHLYKPSELGWIPLDWDVVSLESISSTVTSGSRDWARFYADSGALFIRIGNLTRDHINFRFDSTIYVCPPRNGDGQRTRLEKDDILISITADLGIIGVVPDDMGEAYINQHIALVRPNDTKINSRFIGHYLASPVIQTYISKLNDAGAKAGLNLPTIRRLKTAKPDITEQNLIAERLDEIDHRIKNAIAELSKLRHLKIGLVDDLLTGRVRVTSLLTEATKEEDNI